MNPTAASGGSGRRDFLLELLPKQSIGVEIGVHLGDFSQEILEAIAPRRLHLVDPWMHESGAAYGDAWYGGRAKRGQREMDERYESVLARFDQQIRRGQVVVHRGTSADVMKDFPDGSLDWVYIDGNHLYEHVSADLSASMRATRIGGLITGDDYRDGGWWGGGVKRAVDECAADARLRLVLVQGGQFVFENVRA